MGGVADYLRQYGANAATNIKSSLERMTPKHSIRLVVFVCAYMLFRKYVLAHAAKRQAMQLEANEAADKKAAAAAASSKTRLTPNDMRGGSALEREAQDFKYPGIPYDTDDEEEEEGGEGGAGAASSTGVAAGGWGKKARSRQRKALRMLVDLEEKRLKEKIGDDEDKDIEEFLIDGDGK
jgi:hypothetical protein